MKKIIYICLVITLIVSACKPELTDYAPSKGNADFSKYVAIGDAVSAGMQKVCLSREYQIYSFPNMLAKQFALVGMKGDFKQPLFPEGSEMSLGTAPNGNPSPGAFYYIGNDCNGDKTVDADFWREYSYVTDLPKLLTILTPVNNDGPFNNLSVPGAKSYHLVDANFGVTQDVILDLFSGNGVEYTNPLYFRMNGGAQKSIVDLACEQRPTFFTISMSLYDWAGYAFAGYFGQLRECTPVDKFEAAMTETVKRMVEENGAKGAITNISEVVDCGAFNYIFYNELKVKSQADADRWNAAYPHMHFEVGEHNNFVMEDPSAPKGMRQMKSEELILGLLHMDEVRCNKFGTPDNPFKDENVMDENEINIVNTHVVAYNQIITQLAEQYDLALVDMNKLASDVHKGMYYQGVKFGAMPATGFFYNIDGTHPSNQGNVVVANTFIEAINKKYNCSIPLLNLADYPPLTIPPR